MVEEFVTAMSMKVGVTVKGGLEWGEGTILRRSLLSRVSRRVGWPLDVSIHRPFQHMYDSQTIPSTLSSSALVEKSTVEGGEVKYARERTSVSKRRGRGGIPL